MKLHFANVDENLYFQPKRSLDMDGAVHQPMQSKHYLSSYKEIMKEVLCSPNENGVSNENQERRKKTIVGYIQILSDMMETVY